MVGYDPLGVMVSAVELSVLPLHGLGGGRGHGNAAVIKPSELAPATSEVIARLVPRYLDSEAIRWWWVTPATART